MGRCRLPGDGRLQNQGRYPIAANEVRIIGADDFARDLNHTARSYPESVRDAADAVAHTLAMRARMRGQLRGGVAGKAAEDIRARADVVVAGQRAPFFMGAEYGAIRYRQFESWRGNDWRGWSGSPGRMIGATVRADARVLMAIFLARLDAAHRNAFPSNG